MIKTLCLCGCVFGGMCEDVGGMEGIAVSETRQKKESNSLCITDSAMEVALSQIAIAIQIGNDRLASAIANAVPTIDQLLNRQDKITDFLPVGSWVISLFCSHIDSICVYCNSYIYDMEFCSNFDFFLKFVSAFVNNDHVKDILGDITYNIPRDIHQFVSKRYEEGFFQVNTMAERLYDYIAPLLW